MATYRADWKSNKFPAMYTNADGKCLTKDFWREIRDGKQPMFAELAALGRNWADIVTSSVQAERVFSMMRNITGGVASSSKHGR